MGQIEMLDEAVYGQHNEGCTCPACTRAEKWYNEHRTECMPERSRELRFS